jgi:DNA-binding PadR family transcriptional regulator
MLEVTPTTALTIAKALRSQVTGVPVVFTLEDNIELLKTSKFIISRLDEEQTEDSDKLYEIWAKGRIRSHLFFKREKDILIGKEYGRNFLDACQHYFSNYMHSKEAYNPRKNTLSGHTLYCRE